MRECFSLERVGFLSLSTGEIVSSVASQAEADLVMLSGLTEDINVIDAFKNHRSRLWGKLSDIIMMEKQKK